VSVGDRSNPLLLNLPSLDAIEAGVVLSRPAQLAEALVVVIATDSRTSSGVKHGSTNTENVSGSATDWAIISRALGACHASALLGAE